MREQGASPFFSVCVPVYNGGDYLLQCLQSISRQTFEDFEIILVDDRSTDASYRLVEEYMEEEKRLRLFRNEVNLGLVQNWNACLLKARGTWIKFLFQDDFWYPECLSEIYREAKNNFFVFHDRDIEFSEDADKSLEIFYKSSRSINRDLLKSERTFTPEQIARVITKRPGYNFFGEPSNVAFKREVINHVGKFDNRLAQLCDYEFWCRVSTNFGAFYLDKRLSTFRVHSKSASTANLTGRKIRYKYLDKLVVLHEFSRGLPYQNLRFSASTNDESYLDDLYQRHLWDICRSFANSSSEERAVWKKEVAQYAEFASAHMSVYSWPFIRHRMANNLRQIWHKFR